MNWEPTKFVCKAVHMRISECMIPCFPIIKGTNCLWPKEGKNGYNQDSETVKKRERVKGIILILNTKENFKF